MKVGIVGSRSFNDYELLKNWIDKICSATEIVSGGAYGADKLAEKFAEEHSIPIKIYKPDWNKYGKSAGMIRNGKIVEASDIIVAFWDLQSAGTKDSINKAIKSKKQCIIVPFMAEKPNLFGHK